MKKLHVHEVKDQELIEALERVGFGNHDGYAGTFTRNEADGAIRNGTRIKKVWSERGDTHQLGSKGIVLGSLFVPGQGYAYFIEWDATPKFAMMAVAKKIEPDRES